jgi:hypothetical protein
MSKPEIIDEELESILREVEQEMASMSDEEIQEREAELYRETFKVIRGGKYES